MSTSDDNNEQMRLNALAYVQQEILSVHNMLDKEGVPRELDDDDGTTFPMSLAQRVQFYIEFRCIMKRVVSNASNSTH